jgi:hypothetical protein
MTAVEGGLRCVDQCGEWRAREWLELWLNPSRLHLKPPPRHWHDKAAAPACVSCGRQTDMWLLDDREIFRCQSHGYWFDRSDLAVFEEAHEIGGSGISGETLRRLTHRPDGTPRDDRELVHALLRRILVLEREVLEVRRWAMP